MTTLREEPIRQSAPRVPQLHLFDTDLGPHALIVDRSRIYGLGTSLAAALREATAHEDVAATEQLLTAHGLGGDGPAISDDDFAVPTVKALSLAVAQKCNLGCTYCYAREGAFGGPSKAMPLDVAMAAVERLLRDAASGERVHLSFLGGEPLANRAIVRATTIRAVELGAELGVEVGLSITTNGTLITPDDGAFFERHAFSVTVSLDGVGAVHDQLRSFKGGQGSYDQIVSRVAPLLAVQRQMQISARVTVTPRNLDLKATLEHLLALGFSSVGFSPMLSSPTGRDEMDRDDLDKMLAQMIDCGREFEQRVLTGKPYRFANMVNAMREIHRGTHRPYPCGAGASYLGVSADGDLYACHRFVGDPQRTMGNLAAGIDDDSRARWLRERHVHRQEPCRSCWARYLCGGGCHHEVLNRGRPACDFIRGWLHYCLGAYVRLSAAAPDYFGRGRDEPAGTSQDLVDG
jgi:uncharacterized protein